MTYKNSMAYHAQMKREERYRKENLPNRISPYTDVVSEMEERERVTDRTFCAMKKMLPDILVDLAAIRDPRTKNIKHQMTMLLAYGILMFALHYSSRRETNREMTDAIVRENLKALLPELEIPPHGDTLYIPSACQD